MTQNISRPTEEGILVLDYGSQYTLLIARKLRELGIYSEIIDGSMATRPFGFKFHGIILSGGPDSVSDLSARSLPDWVLKSDLPILGICYGMQLLTKSFGGQIAKSIRREYGKGSLKIADHLSPMVSGWLGTIPLNSTVWLSHGDSAEHLEEFDIAGSTSDGTIAIIAHKNRPIFGVQFHPEVHHTVYGSELLRSFSVNICRSPLNWHEQDRINSILEQVKNSVGDGIVLMAVSGGVDSTVAVKVLSKALGAANVLPVFVDNGLLRKDEVHYVQSLYQKIGINNLVVLDKSHVFIESLKGVDDPEKKRKIIGREFIAAFEEFANSHINEITHLGQGTLYPDVIESAGHGVGSKVIKSHHNVGGLPEHLKLKLVEPFRFLFKDEVRSIGLGLGIPDEFIHRHPFPGPGLAVRVLGDITEEKLNILRQADHIYLNRLHQFGYYQSVWQAFAVLLPVKTVGVMGDNRTYQWTCALRAVAAIDGMTASVSCLPMDFLTVVADEIIQKVEGINRVVYDITSKPPGTIEWE